jgi:dTDP-4-dehydrorhamnose reductase
MSPARIAAPGQSLCKLERSNVRIVVIGSRGQLGSELCRQLGDEAIGLDRAALDITDPAAVASCLSELAPDAVVNTAAYTLVDKAEQQTQLCDAVNRAAVGHLAETCRQLDCVLVQISSDYVFGADRSPQVPWLEQDEPAPQGVYAVSKLAGEHSAANAPRHFIVRTCGLYGQRGSGHAAGNFVDTMLRLSRERTLLRVVDDQHCTPSFVPDVAAAIQRLLGTSAYGVYHVVNAGATTWHDFAAEIFRQRGIRIDLERITTAQYAAPAPRPAYSVLDTSKLESLIGAPLRPWREALAAYLAIVPH